MFGYLADAVRQVLRSSRGQALGLKSREPGRNAPALYGLAAKIGEDRLFPTLPTAVAAYRQWAAGQQQHPGEEPGRTPDAA